MGMECEHRPVCMLLLIGLWLSHVECYLMFLAVFLFNILDFYSSRAGLPLVTTNIHPDHQFVC